MLETSKRNLLFFVRVCSLAQAVTKPVFFFCFQLFSRGKSKVSWNSTALCVYSCAFETVRWKIRGNWQSFIHICGPCLSARHYDAVGRQLGYISNHCWNPIN